MKSTIPFVCAALVGTAVSAQPSFSQPTRSGTSSDTPVSEVFFEFNSASMPATLGVDLLPIAAWAKANPSGKIVLDGNADSVGAAAYNIRLSARRAETVRDELVALGVDSERLVIAVYGEDGLRRTTAALDRRVTIWTTYEPLHAIVDHTFVRGKAVLWETPVTYAEINPETKPDAVATRE